MITTHPAYGTLKEEAEKRKTSIHEGDFIAFQDLSRPDQRSLAVLHDELEKLRQEAQVESFTELTKDMHMYPDLHGMFPTCS
jgi:hypothetical protein